MLACWGPTFYPVAAGLSADQLEAELKLWTLVGWRLCWECKRPGRELQCINAACVRYAVSVRPKEFACLFDCD
jgi:hypothetical protein